MTNPDIKEIINKATTDLEFRISLTRESFYWFLIIYFSDFLDTRLAPFHREIIKILQDDDLKNYALAAFRGSGKSTIVPTAFVLWEILGKHNKKFIILISNTSRQSETHFQSIKESLERNQLLKNDMGPFKELSTQWNTSAIVFNNYKAKIMAPSINESHRGIRYLKHRPQVIVCDDVETLEIIRSVEGKQKLNEWFDRDIKNHWVLKIQRYWWWVLSFQRDLYLKILGRVLTKELYKVFFINFQFL